MRFILAILVGKLIFFLTRNFKLGGGSAAPGLYALSIEPNLVAKLAAKIPKNVVITGTNGKTTTAKMLAHFAKETGLKVIRNHTGSNLERGIASTLISCVNLCVNLKGCRLNFDLGIWELDEAAFNNVTPKLNPEVVIFLNVFRDQLDRYGEIDTVTKNWCQALKKLSSETAVLVNGDDANILKLAACFRGKVQKFGVKDYTIAGESIIHKKEIENLDFEAKNVKTNGLTGISFSLSLHYQSSIVHLPVPGIYHIYDFLAAFAAGTMLNIDPDEMVLSLKTYSPAFGRVEKFHLNPTSHRTPTSEVGYMGYIFLIKNPAGATQVFETIAPNIKPGDRMLLALNDNIADGTDVSWIWDANFELIQNSSNLSERAKSRDYTIIASGSRANDLALRLKYANFNPKEIKIQPDLKQALKQAGMGLKGKLFILPTYTAMLELQSILTKAGIKKHYWEDE
ncbi:MAG: MurT ligase domain-containing protein [Candidatus Daviesbacteria bacterium]|nr:MurT ligase domain-containing protein [Candidatus Daviesbacteria bacterium]